VAYIDFDIQDGNGAARLEEGNVAEEAEAAVPVL